MTSREEFEQWYQRDVSGCNGEFVAKDDAGEYLEVYTFRAWIAWQAARATAPAWHDVPTAPGVWICNEGVEAPYDWRAFDINKQVLDLAPPQGERWFGPIPQDAK